jgi:DNA modification methylase
LNIGDSYTGGGGYAPNAPSNIAGSKASTSKGLKAGGVRVADLPSKNLLGIPWRVAFALQDDGWILRNDIIWAKANGMPSSVKDRLSNRHEHLFLFSKSPRYWFDLEAIREEAVTPADSSKLSWARPSNEALVPGHADRQKRPNRHPIGGPNPDSYDNRNYSGNAYVPDGKRNPGDVWTLPTVPFTGAHFAVMPLALAERSVEAGCKPGGVVLDPYSGSGTTGLAAARHGRRYVGIDLNAGYLDLSLRTRLAQAALFDDEASA